MVSPNVVDEETEYRWCCEKFEASATGFKHRKPKNASGRLGDAGVPGEGRGNSLPSRWFAE
jgi:hypothetical protein